MSDKVKRVMLFSLPKGLVVHFRGIPIELMESTSVKTATENAEVVWQMIKADQSDEDEAAPPQTESRPQK